MKSPGLDGIHGFLFKKFTFSHDRQAIKRNRCLQKTNIHEWMTKGKTTLMLKGHPQRNHPKQLWTYNVPNDDVEILTAEIREEIYNSLISSRLFPEVQKTCRKGSRRSVDLPCMDQHILKLNETVKSVYDLDWQQKRLMVLSLKTGQYTVSKYWKYLTKLKFIKRTCEKLVGELTVGVKIIVEVKSREE